MSVLGGAGEAGGAYLGLRIRLQRDLVHLLCQSLCSSFHGPVRFAGVRRAASWLRAAPLLRAGAAWGDGGQAASFSSMFHINIYLNA